MIGIASKLTSACLSARPPAQSGDFCSPSDKFDVRTPSSAVMTLKRKATEQAGDKQLKSKKKTKSSRQSEAVNDTIHRYKAYAVSPRQADAVTDQTHYMSHAKLGKGFDWDFVVETKIGATPWQSIRSYKNVKLTDNVFRQGDIIYVMNNESMPEAPADDRPDEEHLKWEQKNCWVAQIIEARAQSDKEVLVLVAWLYWPGELPNQSYSKFYGFGETIQSNSLDVIDAMSISAKADELKPYDEFDDDELGSTTERYWRQTYDARFPLKKESLSPLRQFCRCRQPHQPGTKMYQCIRSDCQQWLHRQCLLDEVGEQVWQPYRSEELEDYAANHKPKSPNSLVKVVISPVHALGQLLAGREDISENGTTAAREESATKFGAKRTKNHSTKTSSKTNGNKTAWRDKLDVSILVEDGKSLYARVKEKQKGGRSWNVSIDCLCCQRTLE